MSSKDREYAADLLADALHGSCYSESVVDEVCDPNGGSVAMLRDLLREYRKLSGAALASFVACFAREEAEATVKLHAEREAQS